MMKPCTKKASVPLCGYAEDDGVPVCFEPARGRVRWASAAEGFEEDRTVCLAHGQQMAEEAEMYGEHVEYERL
jgi:hypothetical protein